MEVVRNGQMKQIFMKDVLKGMYAPIHVAKITLLNISSDTTWPFGAILHIWHVAKGTGKLVCFFNANP